MDRLVRYVTDTVGRGPATHIANNHPKAIWVKVITERAYLTELSAGAKGGYAGVSVGGKVIGKLQWDKVQSGFTRIKSKGFVRFDVGAHKDSVFISVVVEERNEKVLICDNLEKSVDYSFIVTEDGELVESAYGDIWTRRN